ncbi:MAG: cytochrome c [Bacteroidota bacterium]
MKFLAVFCFLVTSIIVISCARKSSPSATVAKTSYATSVNSIMQAKCTPCHIPAAGGKKLALDTYTAVKTNIDDIIRRVQLAPTEKGYMPMKHDPLPEAEIALLKKWQAEGAAE